MDLIYFNVNDGFVDAIVRGFRSGFLGTDDYRRLATCDTLEDLRTALDDTDYGNFMQDEPSPLQVQTIVQKCKEKLADEFRYIRCQSVNPLLKFLDLIVAEKMIDNVMTLIQGTLNKKEPKELLSRLDPLGWFEEIKVIPSLDVSAGYDDVYRTILIDTPVGPYFEKMLAVLNEGDQPVSEVSKLVSNMDLAILSALLKKFWLEDFYQQVQSMGGTTAELMTHILKMEADFRTLAITVNMTSSDVAVLDKSENRSFLYPDFGYLYPEGSNKLGRATNEQMVSTALEPYGKYKHIFEQCRVFYDRESRSKGDDKARSLEEIFFGEMCREYEFTFDQQFNYGVVYSWLKLKEQETRNLEWVANMILMNRKERLDDIVQLFAARR